MIRQRQGGRVGKRAGRRKMGGVWIDAVLVDWVFVQDAFNLGPVPRCANSTAFDGSLASRWQVREIVFRWDPNEKDFNQEAPG